MKILYTANASSTGGRDGHSRTDDGKVDVNLSTPKEMGGSGGDGTNPEQLFACGYSACFLGALRFVAGKEKVKIPDNATVSAKVSIGPRDDEKGFGIQAELLVDIPGLEREQVQDLVNKAHVVCPYSHATKGNIQVTTKVA
ncbi:MAG: organic hydroperoxide resistance protein [Puniceicoccaceae bacterium 5H]|nr:MAG: organic hydroperoxide resistance protein [Puniceicoccaceae bacterium 5H]